MTYQEFQMKRSYFRTIELAERAADIASPRPPLNNSLTDQMIRNLFDRVATLEALAPQQKSADKIAPTARAFSLASDQK